MCKLKPDTTSCGSPTWPATALAPRSKYAIGASQSKPQIKNGTAVRELCIYTVSYNIMVGWSVAPLTIMAALTQYHLATQHPPHSRPPVCLIFGCI